MDKNNRCANTTGEQNKLLIDFVKNHENLINTKFSDSFKYSDAKALWSESADILNGCNGANKSCKEWRKGSHWMSTSPLHMDDRWKDAVLLSLKQDLKELCRLTKEMPSRVSRSDVASWLFPTKAQAYSLPEDESSGSCTYTNCLELLLDRVYVAINFFLAYLDEQFPKTFGNIRKPKRLSLGGALQSLWRKLSTLQQQDGIRNEKEPPTSEVSKIAPKSEREAQTDERTLASCDSCSVALTSVKRIANTLDVADSKTKETREKLRLNIYDSTVFGSMLNLTASIESDVVAIVEANRRLLEESRRSASDFSVAKRAHGGLMKKLLLTEANYEQLLLNYDNCKIEYSTLLASRNDLLQIKSDNELKLVSHDSAISAVQRALSSLRADHKTVSAELEESLERNKLLEMKFAHNSSRIRALKKSNAQTSQKLVTLLRNVDDFLEAFERRVALSDKRISRCNLLLVRVQDAIKCGTIKQEAVIACLKGELIKYGSCQNEKATVAGDPLDDMMRQIDANEASMKKLREENDSLMKTVKKLKRIRLSRACYTLETDEGCKIQKT